MISDAFDFSSHKTHWSTIPVNINAFSMFECNHNAYIINESCLSPWDNVFLYVKKSSKHNILTCLLSSWSSRLASSLAFSTSLRVLLSSLASFWIAAFCSSKTASQLKFSSQTKLQLLHVWISIVKLATTYLQLVILGVKAQLKFWIEFLYWLIKGIVEQAALCKQIKIWFISIMPLWCS